MNDLWLKDAAYSCRTDTHTCCAPHAQQGQPSVQWGVAAVHSESNENKLK